MLCYYYYIWTGNIGMFCLLFCILGLLQQTHFELGNAKLDGLTTELDLTGDRYSIALVRHFFLLARIPLLIRVTDHVFYGVYFAFVFNLALQLVFL